MLEIAHSSVLEEYYTGWAPIMSITSPKVGHRCVLKYFA